MKFRPRSTDSFRDAVTLATVGLIQAVYEKFAWTLHYVAFDVAFGGKRTCRVAWHMSAFDPKRTSPGPSVTDLCLFTPALSSVIP